MRHGREVRAIFTFLREEIEENLRATSPRFMLSKPAPCKGLTESSQTICTNSCHGVVDGVHSAENAQVTSHDF
jgi:hypothetical protein